MTDDRHDSPQIGILAEKSLHAALKAWYARPGDQIEVKVDNFVIDIVRGQTLIEIQTGNFAALKHKLARLLARHRVHVVHPIRREKWIVRQAATGALLQRRRSPKTGQVWDIFNELVYIPHLVSHPNFSLEILFTHEEEILRDDGQGSWRRQRWSLHDRHLLDVVDQVTFGSKAAWAGLLPAGLGQSFTNQALATALQIRLPLARKVSYTLRQMKLITVVGKQGNTLIYDRA
jgi:hypothetical protein